MNVEDFYKETKPYLWESDSPQKDEGFYGKDDIKRFAEEYHQAKLKLLGIADVVGQSEQCTHENEVHKQGDGFIYTVCGDCGEDLD